MELVRVDVENRVAMVTLDDPGRRNALSMPMVGEIVEVFDRLDDDPDVGAVIITGAGPAFCAGADLSHLGGAAEGGLRDVYEGFLRIGRSPLPTVAAINGAAVGAGMNLALVCDVRLAARSARFDTRFLQLGLHPGGGHTWMMHRLVGPQTAAATVLFGEVLDGEAAERYGLVWHCVHDGALHDEARELAGRAAAAPRELVAKVKGSLKDASRIFTHEAAVDAELVHQVWSIGQPAFAERLQAMRDRIAGS